MSTQSDYEMYMRLLCPECSRDAVGESGLGVDYVRCTCCQVISSRGNCKKVMTALEEKTDHSNQMA